MSRLPESKGIKHLDSSSTAVHFVESRSNYTLGAHVSASHHSPLGPQERVPLKHLNALIFENGGLLKAYHQVPANI